MEHATLSQARDLVRFYIAGVTASGKLQAAALEQKRVAVQIALLSPMRDWVETGQVTIPQLERWIMEAISSEAKAGMPGGSRE
jgi:hypothetical protein